MAGMVQYEPLRLKSALKNAFPEGHFSVTTMVGMNHIGQLRVMVGNANAMAVRMGTAEWLRVNHPELSFFIRAGSHDNVMFIDTVTSSKFKLGGLVYNAKPQPDQQTKTQDLLNQIQT